jgi:two-component SAPR family response regulator
VVIACAVGDASHPNAVEAVKHYSDWAERNKRILEEVRWLLLQGICEMNSKQEYINETVSFWKSNITYKAKICLG